MPLNAGASLPSTARANGQEVQPMVDTVADAITRLKIVKNATNGEEPSELAAVEAFTAVNACLNAILDASEDDESDRGRMIYALAVNALGWANVLPMLGILYSTEGPVSESAFVTFAHTVELLIELHDEEADQ